MLVRVEVPVDPDLEAAAVVRRVYRAGGPALLFVRPVGCRFPLVGNLFGTMERTRYIFRDTLDRVRRLVELRAHPGAALRRPGLYAGVPRVLWHCLPRRVSPGRAPVLARRLSLEELPRLRTWPGDGGAYITLPLVYSEDPERPGWLHSNLGMYRVQLSGGQYRPGEEVGLHYQIHRGIGVHHAAALRRGRPLRVSVCVGGPPALTVAAVMPLPEGLPEVAFAGALGGRRVALAATDPPLLAEADFCLVGQIEPGRLLPEGPFGDHLGYYSLAHDFPVMRVEAVWCRRDAVWPFTTVGRPPQEDTTFGRLVHELTGPVLPALLPGVKAVHAVDAAGVHPLLLALGSERYTPYQERRAPQEILTQALAILGQGQLSLAKYLLIAAWEDDPSLDVQNVPAFLTHLLERLDPERDLHFHTCTTMDTLDYSGPALHRGSKVVMAAVGPPRRRLARQVPELRLPRGFAAAGLALPGVLVLEGPPFQAGTREAEMEALAEALGDLPGIPLAVVVDDGPFAAGHLDNFLWVTFTRSDPAPDIFGAGAFVRQKHWGCRGTLVIDARLKPQHAPPLEEDPQVTRRVEALAAPGGPLHGLY